MKYSVGSYNSESWKADTNFEVFVACGRAGVNVLQNVGGSKMPCAKRSMGRWPVDHLALGGSGIHHGLSGQRVDGIGTC